MRALGAALALALWPALGFRAEAGAPAEAGAQDAGRILDAMRSEMRRSIERLRLEGQSAPYFIAYTVEDGLRFNLESAFGAVQDTQTVRSRRARVEVRVGSAAFDSSHFAGRDYWRYRPLTGSAPFEADADALRDTLWKLTDQAYKGALEQWARKEAYRQAKTLSDFPPDLSTAPVRESIEDAPEPPFDPAPWLERLRGLSSLFKEYPLIQKSGVHLYATLSRRFFLDSEGRAALKRADDFELIAEASTQASDGQELSLRRRVLRRRPEELPPPEELAAFVKGLAEDLSALARAPKLEPYTGPVLLEGQAAAEFLNQLLAEGVSACRAPWVEEESLSRDFAPGALCSRLGLRVASPLLSAEDDPSLERFAQTPLLGGYRVDDEGIAPVKLKVLEKGRLVGVPMDRAPLKERSGSNGRARGGLGEFPQGHIGILRVWAEPGQEQEALKRELLARAKDFGLDCALLIRELGEEDAQEKDELLAAPLRLYRVCAGDDHETLLRAGRFSGVTPRALRDVVAASRESRVYDFYRWGAYRHGREQTQASLITPESLLLSELELKPDEKKPKALPKLGHPFFAP